MKSIFRNNFQFFFFRLSFGFMGMLPIFKDSCRGKKQKLITPSQFTFREREKKGPSSALLSSFLTFRFLSCFPSLSLYLLFFFSFYFYFFTLSFTFLFSFSFYCFKFLFVFRLSFPPNSSNFPTWLMLRK